MEYTSYYVANFIAVYNCSLEVVKKLTNFDEVKQIVQNHKLAIHLEKPSQVVSFMQQQDA